MSSTFELKNVHVNLQICGLMNLLLGGKAFTLSVCPSVWGWNEVFILSSDPMRFHKAHQNLLVNFGSRSDTMSLERSWCLNTCVKNNLFVSWAMALSLVGMKCVILLNRSTTTMIASNPLDGGKLTMKSMDTLSHSLLRINNGRNNPTYFLLNVQFCWQVKQIFTYSSTSSFKLGQQ